MFPLKCIKMLLTETLRFTELNNYLLWRRLDFISLAFTIILILLYAANIYKWFELFHFLVLRADYWFRSLKERSPHTMPCRHRVAVEVQIYSFLTTATPRPLYPREIPQEACLALGPFWTGVKKFTLTGIRISKCPASIYQCRYVVFCIFRVWALYHMTRRYARRINLFGSCGECIVS